MTARTAGLGAIALAALALLAFVPRLGNAYYLALAISLLQYTVLATAWGMFSGPTRYVSLATTAFFGVGAYTVAVLGEILPWPLVLLIAAALGAIVAAIVGLSTLRLSGVYFVIFTFGLTELIRQLVVWFEVNKSRVLGRYVFVDITQADIYWQLLALDRRRVPAGLADRPLAPRLCAARDRRGRDRRKALRDRYHLRQGRAVHDQRHRHDAGRRDHGAALDLYRTIDRLQLDDLVSGADHGAARRRAPAVGTGARRRAADAAVRAPERALSEHVHDHPRLHLPR